MAVHGDNEFIYEYYYELRISINVFTWMADTWHSIRPNHRILNGEQSEPFVLYAKWINLYIKSICSSETLKKKHNERNKILKTNERIKEKKNKNRNWNVVLIHWDTFIFIYELKWRETEKEEIPIEIQKEKQI